MELAVEESFDSTAARKPFVMVLKEDLTNLFLSLFLRLCLCFFLADLMRNAIVKSVSRLVKSAQYAVIRAFCQETADRYATSAILW